MHRRLRRACVALRGRGCGAVSDLDAVFARATSADDVPLAECDVWRLAAVFSAVPTASRAFPLAFTRRFGRTRSWRVALKCLLLLHRLLRTLPAAHPFHADLLAARENGLLSLHPCRFRAAAAAHDLTAFVHSYARFLDEALSCTPNSDATNDAGEALVLIPQLQSLIDRAMDFSPAVPAARRSFTVRPAVEQAVRDSFACYEAVRRSLPAVLDSLRSMRHEECIAGLSIFRQAAEQADRLARFYAACKDAGICGAYEYPIVEKIPEIRVRKTESLVGQMWQLTESSTSPSFSSLLASDSSPTSSPDEKVLMSSSEKWEEFGGEEEPLLIKWEEFGGKQEEESWEALLEACITPTWHPQCLLARESTNSTVEFKSKRDDDFRVQEYGSHTLNPFI